MSYERGMAAIRLECPAEVPHTQYITHEPWLEHLRAKTGRPDADFEQLLDFDLAWNVEGPSLGGRWCDMGHAEYKADGSDKRPAIKSPWQGPEDVLSVDPRKEWRMADFASMRERAQAWVVASRERDRVVTNGTYCSLISFAIGAFGWDDMLMAIGTDEDRFGEQVLGGMADVIMSYVEAWAATDLEVYLTHDDFVWTSGGFLRPEFYRKWVFPQYKRYWECLKDAGKKVLFCADGDYSEYVDDIVAAGADGLIFEPMTDLAMICQKYGQSHVIIGNADCREMTGSADAVRAEVARCMEVGKGCPGYFFAVGNHIPPSVPVANAEVCMDAYFQMRDR